MVGANEYHKRDCNENGVRRSSLPPLYKNQYNSGDRYDREAELGGETSGYGSDNPNHTPEHYQKPVPWNNQSGYESSSSCRDDRPKWGDKGVGVGKFWSPKDETIPQHEPPNWVKRGLQDGEIVVTNSSPAESPEQTYEEHERPYSGSSSSRNRTYIRGQNIPVDSAELAERERRRQIAMIHQEAVRQQLEEREKRRREERERRIKEEQEEELRIEREQEIERKRKEHEQKLLQEKLERERRRKEAIQEALEIAEKEAKLEKMKQKMMKQMNNNHVVNMNFTQNILDKEKNNNSTQDDQIKTKAELKDNNKLEEKKNNNCDQQNNNNAISSSPTKELLNNELNNNNIDIKSKAINTPRENNMTVEGKTLTPREILNNQNNNNNNNLSNLNNNTIITSVPDTARTDNLALVFQTPLETLQNMQYAVLMPGIGGTTSAIPIAVPIALATDRSTGTSIRTENRILTPTQYRNKNKRVCDSSTQTEYSDFNRLETVECREKYCREKMSNIELSYDNRSRKERRSRNEDRRSESMEERPKWGANRPPTRYLKQSEKDPLYQRRKLRQKMRDIKVYDDKNSSDESQMGSPRSYRKKGYVEKRHSRALWRKNDQMFSRNLKMYQTEIVPLESDRDQIYYKKSDNECCCHCRCDRHKYSPSDNVKVDILKIEHNSPRESLQYKAEVIQRTDRLPDCNTCDNNNDILEKLSSLHNGLLLKQEQWEHSPRTPLLSSISARRFDK